MKMVNALGLCILILLFNSRPGCTFCSLSKKFESKLHKRSAVSMCIAECLDLKNAPDTKKCDANYTDYKVAPCRGEFIQNRKTEKKVILCTLDEQIDQPFFNAEPLIKLNLCTHILFGPWHTYNEDKIVPNKQETLYQETKMFAQKHKVKAIMNVGSKEESTGMDANDLSRIFDDPDSRDVFLKAVLALVDEYQFDGINIRWTFPTCPNNKCGEERKDDKNNLNLVMKQLFRELNPKKKLVFLIVSSFADIILQAYDLSTLVNYVDYFYCPTFMYRGAGAERVELGATSREIFYVTGLLTVPLGVPNMKKLLLGYTPMVPTFYLEVPHPKPTFGMKVHENKSLTGYFDWGETCLKMKRERFSVVTSLDQNLAHNTKEVVVFENIQSLKFKIDVYKKIGVGGMYFGFTHKDDSKNECGCGVMPLLRMMAELFNGDGCRIKDCPIL